MRILGIDPGLQITGFGLIDVDGPQLSYVASGTIRTAEAPRGDLPARIRLIFDGVREVVSTYQPDVPRSRSSSSTSTRRARCCSGRRAARRWPRWWRAARRCRWANTPRCR